jgi:hypothetical protein
MAPHWPYETEAQRELERYTRSIPPLRGERRKAKRLLNAKKPGAVRTAYGHDIDAYCRRHFAADEEPSLTQHH